MSLSAGVPRMRSKSSDTSSFDLCSAGAMMWYGASRASWMMYSPRSVSTGSMPMDSSTSAMPISSDTIDLLLMTVLTPLSAATLATYSLASSASLAKKTWPPARSTLRESSSR